MIEFFLRPFYAYAVVCESRQHALGYVLIGALHSKHITYQQATRQAAKWSYEYIPWNEAHLVRFRVIPLEDVEIPQGSIILCKHTPAVRAIT